MTTPRARACATVLKDGRVLLSGGAKGDFDSLDSAEFFDPALNRFLPAGKLLHPRVGHTASLLPNGEVLIVGGRDDHGQVLSAVEVFDPGDGASRPIDSLHVGRYKHTAATLEDGKILIAGGSDNHDWTGQFSSAELYDPSSQRFSSLHPMGYPRFKLPEQSAVLPSGMVLIGGGNDKAELFEPKTGRFLETNGAIDGPRHYMSETLLKNGDVLLAGGYTNSDLATSQAWLFHASK